VLIVERCARLPLALAIATGRPAGFLCVSPQVKVERQDFGFVVDKMGELTVATVQALGNFPEKLVGVAKSIVGGERDENGPMSVVGASRVAGEVASNTDLTGGAGRLPGLAARLAEPVPRAVQLHPAAATGRRPHDRGHLGRHPARVRQALRPARPGVRGRGQAAADRLCGGQLHRGDGVLLVIADIVNPIRLFNG
jgi:hypothetical protein